MLVGPQACMLDTSDLGDVPVLRVRSEVITPLDEDLDAMVGFAASSTFRGADADRWKLLDGAQLREETDMLWACAQVQGTELAEKTRDWDRVLVIGWTDESALVPATRALLGRKVPITVLLGGPLTQARGGHLRANHVVLAHMLRQGQLATVIHNPEPDRVLDVGLDSARAPQAPTIPRAKPVDLGPDLGLPSTWSMPAAPVHFYSLVHVPMGYADGLGELAVCVAAWRSLRDLVTGPPVDVEGTPVISPEEARSRLPRGSVQEDVERRIQEAVSQVVFKGDEPLVEQIEGVLRGVLDDVRGMLVQAQEVERLRLQGLRAFSAVGISFTCQNLAGRLDAIQQAYPMRRIHRLERLLEGSGVAEDGGSDGGVHVTAWRRAFAGLPSRIVRKGQPGWQVARTLVLERFELFRSEFGRAVAAEIAALVERARDPDAPPSTVELRALRERAVRIRETLLGALTRLDERIDTLCEHTVRDDRFVRWATPHAAQLRQLLVSRIQSLDVSQRLDDVALAMLSRRPLGMADDKDFETYQQELGVAVHGLTELIEDVPSYESVLLLILQGRDPPVLRQALAKSEGSEVELHLERPVEPALMNWLTATGMLVVVAPRLQTCAIYWQRADQVSDPGDEAVRNGTTAHLLEDLVLPAPEGDTPHTLVAMVRAASALLVGLVLGVLAVQRHEGWAVHRLSGPGLGLPPLTLLPYDALHLLSHDEDVLARVLRRIEERMTELPQRPDASETVRKLIELASVGVSQTVGRQLGLTGTRFEHIEHPIGALLQRHASAAMASMTDALHSEDLARLAQPPTKRQLADVAQLGPSGGSS